jgi:hypothetical protein
MRTINWRLRGYKSARRCVPQPPFYSPPAKYIRLLRFARSNERLRCNDTPLLFPPADSRGEDNWSGRLDLNQRLHGPEPCALPGCATPRKRSYKV